MSTSPAKKTTRERTEAEEALAEGEPSAEQLARDAEEAKAAKNRLPEIPISEPQTATSQDEILAIVKAHQLWIASVFDPKAVDLSAGRANLKGADLRGLSLAGLNLSGANLEGANLQGCDLQAVNLTAANLRNALMQDADLKRARLTRAKIEGADLRGADLTGAILLGVDLEHAVLRSPESELATPAAAAPERSMEGASAAVPDADDATLSGERTVEGASRAEAWTDDDGAHAEGDLRDEARPLGVDAPQGGDAKL